MQRFAIFFALDRLLAAAFLAVAPGWNLWLLPSQFLCSHLHRGGLRNIHRLARCGRNRNAIHLVHHFVCGQKLIKGEATFLQDIVFRLRRRAEVIERMRLFACQRDQPVTRMKAENSSPTWSKDGYHSRCCVAIPTN